MLLNLLFLLTGFVIGVPFAAYWTYIIFSAGDLVFYQDEDGTYPVIEANKPSSEVLKSKYVIFNVRKGNNVYSGAIEES